MRPRPTILIRDTSHKRLKKLRSHKNLIPTNLKTSKSLLNRRLSFDNTCDVICIAANEETYIAKFIHHYIFQGFSNLYIGINNSTDSTKTIVEKISTTYPNIYFFNTDEPQQRHGQRGSYSAIFAEVPKSSSSSHCLIVDIDEYWIANSIDTKIGKYLKTISKFDVLFCNWICTYGQNFKLAPIDFEKSQCTIKATGKSIINYDCPIEMFRAHIPSCKKDPESISFVNSAGEKINWFATKKAKSKDRRLPANLKAIKGKYPKFKLKQSSWIIHQLVRSENEYSLSLLQADCAQHKEPTPFKRNRSGFKAPQTNPNHKDFIDSLQPNNECLEKYQSSYNNFLARCCIQKDIRIAQSKLSTSNVISRINTLSIEEIILHQEIWKKTFKGTQFYKLLENKLSASKQSKRHSFKHFAYIFAQLLATFRQYFRKKL